MYVLLNGNKYLTSKFFIKCGLSWCEIPCIIVKAGQFVLGLMEIDSLSL